MLFMGNVLKALVKSSANLSAEEMNRANTFVLKKLQEASFLDDNFQMLAQRLYDHLNTRLD